MTKLFACLLMMSTASLAWADAPTNAPPVAKQGAPAPAPAAAPDTPATPADPAPAAATTGAKPADTTPGFAQFGFAPALYAVHYRQKVLGDSKDVRLRGDGAIAAPGSRLATYMGVELHYGFSSYNKVAGPGPDGKTTTRGHTFSPFIGLFDIDSGINGIALGAMYSFWNGDENYKKTSALNVGLGWTLHKNRLVLADGVREGEAPKAGLTAEDYTQRKDVKGLTLTVSASFGF
jgi:hypothetical protein